MTSHLGDGRTSAYAHALARSGHFREAAVLFESSTGAGAAGITLAARCLLMAGDPNAARESLDRVAPRWRFDGEIVRLRAEANLGAGAFEDAVAAARELTQAAPFDFGGLILLSEALLRVGEPDGALRAADRAVLVQPNAPDGYRARASAAQAMGDHDEVIEAARRASTLAPGDMAARRLLGEALVATGQRGEGQRQLAAVVAVRPNDARASDALLNSSLPQKRFRWLLPVLVVALPLLALGIAAWTTHSGDAARGAAFYVYVFTMIAISVWVRRRADPMVRDIRRDVLRRARHGDFAAVRPFFSWALIAIGACSMAAGVGGLVVPMQEGDARPTGGLLGALAFGTLIAGLGARFLQLRARTRAPRVRWRPRRGCACRSFGRLTGRTAASYAKDHLVPLELVGPEAIEALRCPSLGTVWVWFPDRDGSMRGGRESGVLVRLVADAVGSNQVPEPTKGTGFDL